MATSKATKLKRGKKTSVYKLIRVNVPDTMYPNHFMTGKSGINVIGIAGLGLSQLVSAKVCLVYASPTLEWAVS